MRKAQIMKRNALKAAALIIALSAVPALAGDFGNASVRNCTWCHGPSAQGYAPAPRLAGQQSRYMWYAAANLNRQSARDLASYFSSLRPQAAADGDRALVDLGRTIFQQGLPQSNVAACVACHGPRAQGVGEIPRLGGLSYSYLQNRIEQWNEGYDARARWPMPHVASTLSTDQIAALASYLSYIK
jgi:cytochrome c553